ncbi:glyoxalase [Saccharomonospora piscinae]|uniref:Glyoxalase n=1 Tax=Saccharomonospora piscinae TaxID=687388 RepID=A0A1V8ZZT5_SACPI|nr:VOC family protein [Saccharomonospora piscinae]OQO90184.1 glyoxalase [Saccharomonospora piscinae]TLW89592.1 VOC family protein [Saccharomonospora piscinae]
MTVRDTPYPDGTPCWVDLMVADPRMAMDFYGALFGWNFADQGDEAGNYLLCSIDDFVVTGVGGMPPDQPSPPVWTTYLATSDVDDTAARVRQAGGQLMVEPMDVMSEGRMAMAADPTGAVFGLWQAGRTIGAQLTGTPSALVWNECMTRDFATAKGFYTDVFGYAAEDMSDEQFTYAALLVGDRYVGGVGELPADVPADVPPHWMTYFGVADTDAAVARVGDLGGSVVTAPFDTPYGRMAAVADNQGVAFSVIAVTAVPDSPE